MPLFTTLYVSPVISASGEIETHIIEHEAPSIEFADTAAIIRLAKMGYLPSAVFVTMPAEEWAVYDAETQHRAIEMFIQHKLFTGEMIFVHESEFRG